MCPPSPLSILIQLFSVQKSSTVGIIHEACSILRILTIPNNSNHQQQHHHHHEDRIEHYSSYSPNLNSYIHSRTQSHLISSAKKSAGVVVTTTAAAAAAAAATKPNPRQEYAVNLERKMKDSYSEDSELTDSSGHTKSSYHFQANLDLDLGLDFEAKPMDKVSKNAEQIVNMGGVQLLLQILSHFDVIK